ncbi:MAG: sugar ABC transporter ATP-binding protein [Synergistaceae bacterium]|jgi:erythritol transport system ATP-binding protein|nr:sugar ABC transporter ATP-binding protein [Synergistaceae bacterium]
MEPILTALGIKKIYPGSIALDDVDFNVYPGRVNVLIGENGAGKSTLMKIIAGAETATEGEIAISGSPVRYSSTHEAERYGVGIIFQELNIFPNMTVAENIFIAHERMANAFSIDKNGQNALASEILGRLQQNIDPGTIAGNLRIGQQQIVEIARALSHDTKILIMDEPTSALSEQEVDVLFRVIEELKADGVAIIYISHRLEEIMKIGDRVTVLRDGRLVAESDMADVDLPWIIRQMTGSDDFTVDAPDAHSGEILLEVEHLSLPGYAGSYKVEDVSFKLYKGEILGIYGLMGAGRTELLECLIGACPEMRGRISLAGTDAVGTSIEERIADGFSLIPEDRKNQGLIVSLPVLDNMTLSSLRKYVKLLSIATTRERSDVERTARELGLKTPSVSAPVSSLSGGNQQKTVIGKNLLTKPRVLLMDEPTRGIDVAAKRDVFNIITRLAREGLGIILVSSELKEILTIPSRVLVLSKGKLTGEFERGEMTREKLVRASAANIVTNVKTGVAI